MSGFLVVSLDSMGSPTVRVPDTATVSRSEGAGWGFGWYPEDAASASVVKDSSSDGALEFAAVLSNWKSFNSTSFLIKIRGASKRYTPQSTQPFVRSYAGRDWLFLHNGDLDRRALNDLFEATRTNSFHPIGTTDSELAFGVLLARVKSAAVRTISDLPWETWRAWFQELDQLGTADFAISDGRHSIVYHGGSIDSALSFARFLPADEPVSLAAPDVEIALDNPADTYRTALVVSSHRFDTGDWTPMERTQMLAMRRGVAVWSSHEKAPTAAPSPVPDEDGPTQPRMAPVPTIPNPMPSDGEVRPFSSTGLAQAASGPAILNVRSMMAGPDGTPLRRRTFHIYHRSLYIYSKPVQRSEHVLRLHPVEDNLQEIVHSTLSINTAGEMVHFDDVFGNHSIHAVIEKEYDSMEIIADSQVIVYARPGDDLSPSIRRQSIPVVWMPWQQQMLSPYLLPPELPETQLHELTEFAMSIAVRNDHDLIETLIDMNKRIFEDFAYISGSTTTTTSPFEVYANRTGVCQDFANLFICLARLLSVPARYRVGYIHTGNVYNNPEQGDASHAWAEAYIPYVGWRGFDPTNGIRVNQDHIRVACGRNYRDATPTSGTLFRGGGTETLSVQVRVEEITS